jgi:hypothetical protein
MNKKIYALMLTAPLLFSACNSTAVTPKVEAKPVTIKTEAKKVEKTITTTTTKSKDVLVTHANDKKIVKDEGMMHIESFMETLKPTLMGLMKSDKTNVTAMGGCSSMAMSMTNDYNNISETKIRRTALKYRNIKNKPDATDTVVMEGFISSKNFKEPVVIEMNDHYRVYKALPVQQPCLACHGANITPELTKMLERTYPKDMATNFKLGEFRGVVVAKVKK